MVFLGDGAAWPVCAKRWDAIRITATAGFETVPDDIQHALLMTIAAIGAYLQPGMPAWISGLEAGDRALVVDDGWFGTPSHTTVAPPAVKVSIAAPTLALYSAIHDASSTCDAGAWATTHRPPFTRSP